ncbi:MAG: hypothetical protein AAFY06_14770 [Pseudomonadota bacterium]
MHLLAAQAGEISDGDEAIDLGQTPGDVIFLSAADTEIALLSKAHDEGLHSLRLANLMQLKHPMSVDVYLQQTCPEAKIIIARLLGGRSYWPYLVDELTGFSNAHAIPLVLLPGDNKVDEELIALSSVDHETYTALWAYLAEGGTGNAKGFLSYITHLLNPVHVKPRPAKALPKSGLYWPGVQAPGLINA